jgi:hypothetical protein
MKRSFSCCVLLLAALLSPLAYAADTTIYLAKKIITMDAIQPEATAVAVKSDGRIFSLGALADMQSWMKAGSYTVDNTFANDVITPGMIEAHCHWTMLAVFMQNPYVGYFDFPDFFHPKSSAYLSFFRCHSCKAQALPRR